MKAADWWKTFEEASDETRDLVKKYHPQHNRRHGAAITAPRAEVACEQVRAKIRQQAAYLSPLERFDTAVLARDHKGLVRLLNEAWFGMPESTSVREEPGFFALCGLCEGVDEDEEPPTASA